VTVPGPNEALADQLAEVAALLRTRRGERFRARAYDRAARVVRATAFDVTTLDESELQRLEGIGTAIAGVISEYAQTGQVRVLERLLEDEPAGFAALLRLPLIGLRDARALAGEHGLGDPGALRAAAQTPGGLDHVGEKLAARVRESLRRVDAVADDGTPFPLAKREAERVAASLRQLDDVTDVLVGGEVRRAKDLVRSHALSIITDRPDQVSAAIDTSRAIMRVLDRSVAGPVEVALAAGPKAQLWVADAEAAGAALLHATGSDAHVAALRAAAARRGLLLRPDGLWRGDDRVAGASEEEIYAALDLPFLPPELRETDRVPTEASALVRAGELRGDLHVHTDWSRDGKASMDEMLLAAMGRGYEYVALTDHAENLTINGMPRETVLARRRTIKHLQQEYPHLRILDGAELNIGLDGSLDYDLDFLLEFDFTVASIHSHMAQDCARQTERTLATIAHPAVHVIGHPTGRIIGHRPGYELEMTAIAQAAAETGTALEVNGSPRRLDLSGEMVAIALEAGARIAVSSDAHTIREYGNVENGVPTARRGGATAADVLNCGDVTAVLEFAQRKKRRA
jgi:DNA polymerase (family 10)